MPGVNWPAVEARSRTSPIDRQNMNRAFPGHPTSGPTAMIADFIERVILPQASMAIDLHSGGTKSVFTPCGYVYGMGDRAFRARKLAAAHAFGAPVAAVVMTTSSGGSLSAACERHGVVMVATELGGGAMFDRNAFATGWEGTLNLLRHAGTLRGAVRPTRTALHHTASATAFVMAQIDGLFEARASLDDFVAAGDLAGVIWPMDDLSRDSVPVHFTTPGKVLCMRTMPMVRRGDYLCHTGEAITDAAFLGDA
jgi:predicted deacylase